MLTQFVEAQDVVVIHLSESVPVLEEYETTLNHFRKVESASFSGGYQDLDLFFKKTKIKKLKELSTQEQNVFILELAEKQTKLMITLQKAWNRELHKFDDSNYKPKIANAKVALKEDVEKYNIQLFELRKRYALEYETFIENNFQELDKKEFKFMLNQIQSIHNKENLIERKKE